MEPITKKDSEDFFQVNLTGTENLLKGLESKGSFPKIFVFISTVAVYGADSGTGISEFHPLEGHSPYALSKIRTEQLLTNWCSENNVNLLILRLPLIVGLSPPGNLHKMIQGIKKGRYLRLGRGMARKSMVLGEDVAFFIFENLHASGIYNLTDGYHPSIRELESAICKELDKPLPFSIPIGLAKLIVWVGSILPGFPLKSNTVQKLTTDLIFDDQKARNQLGWKPNRVLDHFSIARPEAENFSGQS